MKILVDMNLSPLWVDTFNKNEIDAIHWSEVGDSRAKDREIMSWARESGYIVFTHDLDFGHLLALAHASGPSVIQVRAKDVLPESIGPIVLRSLQENRAALESGALVVIDPEGSRVRILPI